jgi:hypothetical protein
MHPFDKGKFALSLGMITFGHGRWFDIRTFRNAQFITFQQQFRGNER